MTLIFSQTIHQLHNEPHCLTNEITNFRNSKSHYQLFAPSEQLSIHVTRGRRRIIVTSTNEPRWSTKYHFIFVEIDTIRALHVALIRKIQQTPVGNRSEPLSSYFRAVVTKFLCRDWISVKSFYSLSMQSYCQSCFLKTLREWNIVFGDF